MQISTRKNTANALELHRIAMPGFFETPTISFSEDKGLAFNVSLKFSRSGSFDDMGIGYKKDLPDRQEK
jgi:hypothetical protein